MTIIVLYKDNPLVMTTRVRTFSASYRINKSGAPGGVCALIVGFFIGGEGESKVINDSPDNFYQAFLAAIRIKAARYNPAAIIIKIYGG